MKTKPKTEEIKPNDWPEGRDYIGVCHTCGRSCLGPKWRIQGKKCRICSEAAQVATPDPKPEVPTRVDAYASTLADARYHESHSRTEWMMVVPADFARQLERENAELQKVLSDLMPFVLEDYYANCATMEYREAVEAARAAIKSATP